MVFYNWKGSQHCVYFFFLLLYFPEMFTSVNAIKTLIGLLVKCFKMVL